MTLFKRLRKGQYLDTTTEWQIRLEWKLADMWIGGFWKTDEGDFDLWICILPCLPIHLFRRVTDQRNDTRLPTPRP